MTPNEAKTRKDRIDPALAKAHWDVNNPAQVGIEVPVDGYDAEPWNGVTDYVLHHPDGTILAVVEAKKQMRDPNVARAQIQHYITEIGMCLRLKDACTLEVGIFNLCNQSPKSPGVENTRQDKSSVLQTRNAFS
jgi:hypothetical protein